VSKTTDFEELSVDSPVGEKHAVTHLRVTKRLANATVLDATLDTGRTHQIRIHCASLGHPVLGDRKYGHPTGDDVPQMALHARHLGFKHPTTNKTMTFTTPLPTGLQEWIDNQAS
jgi:23S rRNA pseudouridine1911/1915/1917 synthase